MACPIPWAAITRLWVNAQRDGRPAEYRRRPLLNAAKFGGRPLLECRAETLPIQESARLGRKVNIAPWSCKHIAKFGCLPLSDVAAVSQTFRR